MDALDDAEYSGSCLLYTSTDFQQPSDDQVQQNGTGDDTEAEQGDVEGGSEELLQRCV